jgi:SAM-dependent methyltransferase
MRTAIRPCPVCGYIEFREVFRRLHVVFDGHPLAGEYQVGSCVRCGSVFNRQGATSEAYVTYYEMFSNYRSKGILRDPYYDAIAGAVARLVPNREARILDLGAGGGELLAALQRRGYRGLEGLEPSSDCAAHIRYGLGIPCRTGSITSLEGVPGNWDALLSTGVFEHLLEPPRAVEAFRGLIAPGGHAFVLVPDLERYVECLSTPFQEFSVEHINHFTAASLRGLFARHGWAMTQTGKITREVTPTCSYPDLWCAFSPSEDLHVTESDGAGFRCLCEYVAASERLLTRIGCHIDQALPPGRFVMWGAGQTASLLLADGLLRNRQLIMVIDGNPSYDGRRLCGAPIVSPRRAEVAKALADIDIPILVASLREATAIESTIRGFGYTNPVVLPFPVTVS